LRFFDLGGEKLWGFLWFVARGVNQGGGFFCVFGGGGGGGV